MTRCSQCATLLYLMHGLLIYYILKSGHCFINLMFSSSITASSTYCNTNADMRRCFLSVSSSSRISKSIYFRSYRLSSCKTRYDKSHSIGRHYSSFQRSVSIDILRYSTSPSCTICINQRRSQNQPEQCRTRAPALRTTIVLCIASFSQIQRCSYIFRNVYACVCTSIHATARLDILVGIKCCLMKRRHVNSLSIDEHSCLI